MMGICTLRCFTSYRRMLTLTSPNSWTFSTISFPRLRTQQCSHPFSLKSPTAPRRFHGSLSNSAPLQQPFSDAVLMTMRKSFPNASHRNGEECIPSPFVVVYHAVLTDILASADTSRNKRKMTGARRARYLIFILLTSNIYQFYSWGI
ncbi:hypothetical protein K439DRAFT_636290 [Ramaria rubella]|nr:hypothetical protein K439DRAFT_636290 [Ramaria rubella]